MPRIVELITRRSERVPPTANLNQVAALMMDARISSVIVVDNDSDTAIGILTETDMLHIMRQHRSPDIPVAQVMTKPVHCVEAEMDYRLAFRDAASRGIRHIIVRDENGRSLGIVSEADFRKHLGAEFFHHMNSVDTLMERLFPRLPPQATLEEGLAAMEAVRASCVIVAEGREALGLVTERDIVRLYLKGEYNPTLGAIMTAPVIRVRENCLLAEAACIMQERNIRHLVVVDAHDQLSGLLSEHALMRPLNLDLMDETISEHHQLSRSHDRIVAAHTANEHYRQALFENLPHLVWLKDTESRLLAVNRAYAKAAGANTAEELTGKTDLDIWPPELAKRYRDEDRSVMASGEKRVITEPIVCQKQMIWHETYKAPVIDPSGRVLGTVGFAQDISRRRQQEEAILLRNAALAGLIRNEPLVGVLELIVLSVESEMPGLTCSIQLADSQGEYLDFFAGPRLPEVYRQAGRAMRIEDGTSCCGSAAFHRRRVIIPNIAEHPDTTRYRAAAREVGFAACWSEPILGPEGQLLGTFAAHGTQPGHPSDKYLALLTQSSQLTALILAHHRGADRLQQSQETFRGIFDSVSEALVVQDGNGRILDANRSAEQLFGHPRARLAQLTQVELAASGLNDLNQIAANIQAALAGTPQLFEFWGQDTGGRIFPLEVRLHPCQYFGRPALIASALDISERKHAARRLEIEHDLAVALATGVERKEVLDTILQAALRFPEFDAGCIYARQADGAFEWVAGHGLSVEFCTENHRFAADSQQSRHIRTGTLRCHTAIDDPNQIEAATFSSSQLQREGLSSLTLLPVMIEGEAIACLYLASRNSIRVSGDTQQALESLATNFALTLLRLDAQEESSRLQHNLSGLFQGLTDFIIVFNYAGKILHYNRAVAEQLGYGPEALKGRHIASMHPPEVQQISQNYLAEIIAGQRQTCPLPLLHHDGSVVNVDSRVIKGYWDGQPAIFDIAQDINERLIAEERQKLAASVFDNAHEGIMITDPRGHIIEVNATFSELTGFSREEVIGRTTEMLHSGHHDAAFYREMWDTISTKGFWRGEVWNRKKSGEIFVEQLTISTVRNRTGAISHFVGIFSDITVIKEHQQRLEHLAHFDALTQLPNRMLLGDRMQLAMAQTQRSGKLLAVCYLDLDGFKPVNDQYGHAMGDKLLIEVAQRLKACVRSGDTVSRLGGDEFVLLFSGLEDIHECDHAINRVISQLTTPFRIASHDISISASIGITLYPQDGSDSDTLLRHADQAMYAAKQSGRNRSHLFDPENDRRARARREELGRIRKALSNGEFVLYYQPKVDMRQGHVIGAEALIRWRHPERGLLLPSEFLPAIEGSELSIALGDWVLQEALRQLSIWAKDGLQLAISVNIAGNHLQNAGFAQRLGELLAAHPDVPPHCLELEVLETAALEDIANVANLFARCREFGVSFSLDDFGTGYSSLTYFRRLPADVLKIDQSFVRDMLDDPDDLAIVEGIIGLTQAFQRKVIAEGVESIEHGMVLLQLGCDMAQGYGIARPMPAAEIPDWVRAFRPNALWEAIADSHWSRDDLPMLIAEVEHQRWRQKLLEYLSGPSTLRPPPSDDRTCRFGRWYYGIHGQRHRHMPTFAALEAVHRRLHQIGDELIARHANGEDVLDDPLLAELDTVGQRITRHLQQIQAEVLAQHHTNRR
ncbi:MAG: PAS domain S-box protein [Rhodocyclales bacterium GT-UBC]|nr:MAG: PAS domain S-box protein [Rhodocyclales bacterium GT-UBC]